MSVVFLDTVGLIALWNESDQWHVDAEVAYSRLLSDRSEVVATEYVLLECGNAAGRRSFRQDVVELETTLRTTERLVRPTESDWKEAWTMYQQGHPGDAGIVDCVSMVVMQRLGIADIFSNDRHFADAGFNTLF